MSSVVTTEAEHTTSDTQDLRVALTALARDQGGDTSRLRAATLPLFKKALADARHAMRTRLEAGGGGLECAKMLAVSMDDLIQIGRAHV